MALTTAFLILAVASAAGTVRAADFYVTATGAGAQNGRNWDDAFAFTTINDILNRAMQPGDTLHVEGAAYGRVQIVVDSSGTAGAPKTIAGEDRGHGLPLFGPANDDPLNGHVTAQSCTFCIRSPVGLGIFGESGKVTLNDCIVSFARPQVTDPHGHDVAATYERTAIHWDAAGQTPTALPHRQLRQRRLVSG